MVDEEKQILEQITDIDKRIHFIDKRVSILETQVIQNKTTLAGVSELVTKIYDKLSDHMIQEEKDRARLLGGILITALAAVGSLAYLIFVHVLGG